MTLYGTVLLLRVVYQKDEYQSLTPIPGLDPTLLGDGIPGQSPGADEVVLEDMEGTGVVPLVPPPSLFRPPSLSHKIHVSMT